ncbi:hypothetical protein LSH36_8g08045 [Paralvinella palmiformis]|uniref:Conserved oligomeric Golgi complex subunit 2 n=1 Tax=Paralvinella palmiformis TaxID=53620 RepID=A0AAD9NID1_9ANNE|nr:hypothetical protein LSH36_8g08045 [Paralvinella palmiformis]
MKQPLPSGPSSLCFNKEDFMKENFNVENFIVECRRRVPLENLRDDLNVYLKVLSSAMIELINKDYADFVNLSTNLVGMDKAINNLMLPLNQLKTEILNVRNAMEEAMGAIEEKMNQRTEIRENKACLQRLIKIIQCVKKMENLLGINADFFSQSSAEENPQQSCSRELTGQLIERVATEFNKLQFLVNKSRGLPLVEEIRPRVIAITTTLQYSLEGSFKEGLEMSNVETLCQCLRTYATIDKMRDAENLFRQYIVQPYLEEIITEQYIKNHPNGIDDMYAAILEFIPKHCKVLKDITSATGQAGGEVVRGYDFLVNSVWPEVVTSIENKAHSIFAPGNPAVFHQKYVSSMDFVDKFERHCGSQASVKRLRSHPSYNTFLSKWSLPVYFQIRFQEIAGAFETSMLTPFVSAEDTTLFHLHVSYVLWTCLHECWHEEIYLQPLCHRFWKLTLQLLARYSSWLDEVSETQLSKPESKPTPTGSNNLTLHSNGTDAGNGAGNDGKGDEATPEPVNMLQILGDYYTDNIRPKITALGVKDTSYLHESLQESESGLLSKLPHFGQYIVTEITSQCSGSLKTVNDIPRLYRRTNREVPSKPSTYVSSCVKPVRTFLKDYNSYIADENRTEWLTGILQNIATVYLSITTDVLTSVKKMEESLKRLKKAKSGQNLVSSVSSNNLGLSDDDKIRLQLFLDVTEFGNQIEDLGIDRSTIEDYGKLYSVVEAARSKES